MSRRFVTLRDDAVRARLMGLAAIGYAGLVAVVTWQALRGQSIVHPDGLTLLALAGVAALVAIPSAVVLRRGSTSVARP